MHYQDKMVVEIVLDLPGSLSTSSCYPRLMLSNLYQTLPAVETIEQIAWVKCE